MSVAYQIPIISQAISYERLLLAFANITKNTFDTSILYCMTVNARNIVIQNILLSFLLSK